MDESVIRHLEQDTTEAENVRRLLLRAAEILDVGGHCKGQAVDGDAHCLSGAVSTAALETGDSWDLWHGYEACIKRIHKHLEYPVQWNDAPERTKEEVVAKLRAVALAA
jgi:hypothetical protein